MFGIILTPVFSLMLGHAFLEDAVMQTGNILLLMQALFVYWKRQIFHGTGNILPYEKCAEHYLYFTKLDNSLPFGRPSSC